MNYNEQGSRSEVALLLQSCTLPTPALIYSEAVLRDYAQAILDACSSFGNARPFFALKCCYNKDVCKALISMGFGVEVMTPYEWRMAIKLGWQAGDIICNGMGRGEVFLRTASAAGSLIIVDSENDLAHLESILQATDHAVKFGLRLKPSELPSVDANYCDVDGKLGYECGSSFFDKALRLTQDFSQLRLEFIHVHVTCNAEHSEVFEDVIGYLKEAERVFSGKFSLPHLNCFDVGGGFASFSSAKQLRMFIDSLLSRFKKHCPDKAVWLEPGRCLANPAGFVVTKVLDKKTTSTGKTWLFVDVGTNILIPIPTARYQLFQPLFDPGQSSHRIAIADSITSGANVIVHDARVNRVPEIGETLVLMNCGAYSDVLGQEWGQPIPSSYFLDRYGSIHSSSKGKLANTDVPEPLSL
jgi:diaminopimelate decarboxylase